VGSGLLCGYATEKINQGFRALGRKSDIKTGRVALWWDFGVSFEGTAYEACSTRRKETRESVWGGWRVSTEKLPWFEAHLIIFKNSFHSV
jgi:hypothetical protein